MMTPKADREPAKEAATEVAPDRDESTGLMEPMLISESGGRRSPLADLALEVAEKSAGFRASLPDGVGSALSDIVRSMNCYYSNLIEGHDTHPIDIERALKSDYSTDPRKRDLQLEARAHINVQKWIDEGGLDGRATTSDGLSAAHMRFCSELPDDLLWVTNPDTGERTATWAGSTAVAGGTSRSTSAGPTRCSSGRPGRPRQRSGWR